jgi:hypothetical protein
MGLATQWRLKCKESEKTMTTTETGSGGPDRVIESLHNAGNTALESVRRFLDTVNSVFPDVGADNGPRQQIIDSAFKMTEELVGTSTQLAQRIVKASQDALGEVDKKAGTLSDRR